LYAGGSVRLSRTTTKEVNHDRPLMEVSHDVQSTRELPVQALEVQEWTGSVHRLLQSKRTDVQSHRDDPGAQMGLRSGDSPLHQIEEEEVDHSQRMG